MKNKITTSLILILSCLLLVGCLPKEATDDVRTETAAECVPMAEQWFADNMPKAKLISSNLYSTGYDCTRSVQGSYALDGSEYHFWYNCDTREMLSDAKMDEAKKCVVEHICKEAGISGYNEFRVNNLGFVYEVTYLVNRKNGWDSDEKAETELSKSYVGDYLQYLPINADDIEMDEYILKRLEENHPTEKLSIEIRLEDGSNIIDEKEIDSLLKTYTGIDDIKIM